MAKIKRIKNFQQVAVLKCKKCQNWQGIATTRTQEQLNDSKEQRRFKLKRITCNYCHRYGSLIDLFWIKGVCSNQEAKDIIKHENRKQTVNQEGFSLDFE
jgi:hypothetical protein